MGFFSTTLGKVLKSRTVWGAGILGAIPALQVIYPMTAGTKVGAVIGVILAGYTIYTRIQAKQPLGPVIDETIAKTVEAVHVLGISEGAPPTVAGQINQVQQVTAVVKATK